MALRVWLPLNGDLENKGISDYSITSLGTLSWVDGKISKNAMRAGDGTQIINGLKLDTNFIDLLNGDYSISVWIKPYGTHIHYNGSIFSSGNWNTTNKRWSFGVSQDNSKVDVLCMNYNTYIACPIPKNIWTNIICTRGSDNIVRLYKNGEYIGLRDCSSDPTFDSDYSYSCIGRESYANGYFSFNGAINDFRLYDHCLSPLEVKEISQGLILHYKLSNSSITNFSEIGNLIPNYKEMGLGTANVTTGTWRIAGTNNMTRTRVQITDSPVGECYCFQNSGIQTANDGSCYGIDNTTYFEPNTEYRISMFARITAGTEGYAGYNIYNISGELGGSHTKTDKNYRVTPLNSDGSWTYCWYHIKTNSSATRNIYIGITTGETSVTTQMCLVRIEKWNEGMNNSVIIDSSGYENNGTVIGNLNNNTEENVGRYQNAIYSKDGRTNYIVTPSLNFNSDAVTLNIWFKSNNKTPINDYHMVIDSNAHRQWYEMCVNKSGYLRGGLFVNGTRYADNGTSASILNGNWHMLTMTYDGNIIKRYVDGIMEKSTTVTKTSGLSSPTAVTLFRDGPNATYACQETSLNDFRIYATALSAEDIATLYHTPAHVDNLGGIHGFEFSENDSVKISKQGVVYNKGLIELPSIADGYEVLQYLDMDANSYFNTGYNGQDLYQIDCKMEDLGNSAKSNYWFGQTQAHGSMMFNGLYSRTKLEYNWLSSTWTSAALREMYQTLNGSNVIIQINDETQEVAAGSNDSTGNFLIGACNNVRYYGNPLRFYWLKMHVGNNIIHDFFPCIRKSDSAIGLYDKITKTFITNSGTGTVTAGPILNVSFDKKDIIRMNNFIEK